MTAQTTADHPAATPGAAFQTVMSSALEFVTGKISQKADNWTDKLNDAAGGAVEDAASGAKDIAAEGLGKLADGGGAKQQATIKGVQAGLEGKNPVWAAIKGAWSGASSTVAR